MKKIKYPGELGRQIELKELTAALLDNSQINAHEWRAARDERMLNLLLEHYQIDRNDTLSMVDLCFKLAYDHVPAFSIANRPGRPPTTKAFTRLLDLLPRDMILRVKPGRKVVFTDDKKKTLLRLVHEVMAESGLSGRGAITEAIKQLLTVSANAKGESVSKTLRNELPFMRKRYSMAKKKFPELAK